MTTIATSATEIERIIVEEETNEVEEIATTTKEMATTEEMVGEEVTEKTAKLLLLIV